MQEFEAFKKAVVPTRKGKLGKVRNSFGVYDAYKVVRKHHWYNIGRPLTESEFFGIIRQVNRLLAEEVAKGHTVKFPERMGKLVLKKFKPGAFLIDGKLKVTYPINWNETLLLWQQDAEAYKNKVKVRHDNQWVYHVKYDSHTANYENKYHYLFALNSFIKRNLSKNIKAGKVDTAFV